jgi:hypothetical protein
LFAPDPVPRILVIHRDLAEAATRAARLRSQDFEAEPYASRGTKGFRGIRAAPPDAIVIDLTELPSYGRAIGAMIRESKSLRMIPLVFIEGDPEKTAKVRATLPDAAYAPWAKIGAAIMRAIRGAPESPMLPVVTTPLLAKLGIREGSGVAVLHAPKGFQLPKGTWKHAKSDASDVILAFYPNAAAFGRELPTLKANMRPGRRLWIAWPKKAGTAPADLSMPRIRELAKPYGFSDYKTCAIDEKWAAMVFGVRRSKR